MYHDSQQHSHTENERWKKNFRPGASHRRRRKNVKARKEMQKASLLADNFLLLLSPHLCVFWSTSLSLTYHYNDVCWLHRKNKSNHMLLCNRIWLIYFDDGIRSGPTTSKFERHSKMKFFSLFDECSTKMIWQHNKTHMKLTFFHHSFSISFYINFIVPSLQLIKKCLGEKKVKIDERL